MDATKELATWTAALTYNQLSEAAVSALKRLVLTSMGTTLAANTLGKGSLALLRVVRAAGGTPEATLIGFGDKVPVLDAALINGSMAHELDYDDTVPGAGIHVSGTSIPAALAVAERVGGVDGKHFLTALAAGNEVAARIGLAISSAEPLDQRSRYAYPQPTQMMGYFNAAASASRVLGLDAAQTHHALAMAFMQASGGREPVSERTPAKGIYTAFPNHGGVLSALLAQQGLECECDALEGVGGFFANYHSGRYSKQALLDGLGKRLSVEEVGFRPWFANASTHACIEAGLRLREQHPARLQEIESIKIRGGDPLRPVCEPLEARRNPQHPGAAMNSIFFALAKALVNGKVSLSDFTIEGLRQEAVLNLCQRMTCALEPSLGEVCVVEVLLNSGERHEVRVDAPIGHLSRPMTYQQVADKFRDCASHAFRPLSSVKLDEAIDLVERLETVADIAVLPALLSGLQVKVE